jgi:hypothetical protein
MQMLMRKKLLLSFFYPEDEGNTSLRNSYNDLQDHIASRVSRQQFSVCAIALQAGSFVMGSRTVIFITLNCG